MRRGLFVLFILALGFSVNAQVSTVVTQTGTGQTQISSNIAGISIGYIKVGSDEVGNLAWHPDFKIGPWGLGADVNLALGDKKPSGYENVVLRYLEFDDGKKGLRYGVIDNLTWGHGLLMRGYSTRVAGPVLLNNEQMGMKGYFDTGKYVFRFLGTRRNVYGLRLEERVHPLLILGQTYITDTDGVQLAGTPEVQKISGAGLDATVPLPFNFEGYAEWAQLLGRGSGLSVGIDWAYDLMVINTSFLAEYRFLDNNFVPGYFDANYETNPINLSLAAATGNRKNGYLVQYGLKAMDMASLSISYENYIDSDASLAGELYGKLPQNIEISGYYKQPKFVRFSSISFDQGAVAGASIAYPLNQFTKLVLNYKKVFNPNTGKVEESQFYEIKLNF